ncbi:hypothetical protein KQX54_006984 [Cotesia glomerata]|uniref:Aminopeptidase N-like N-terminal domain-containing protein n=1 Tax=Cotesia glomerata TaxID=32391 RepID=A0AAV7J6A2_COTGL|nr:hypothetical protein KQX54_006984 [Cotesia glomerata]
MTNVNSLITFAFSLCGVFIFLLRYVNSNSDLQLDFVLPTHYTIKLEINMTENNFNYNGESYVDIKIKEPTSFIILQADLEIIGNITVKSDKKIYQSQSHSIHKTTDLLTIQFNETMRKGYYQMHIKYKIQIFKSSVGLTRHSYIDEFNQKQWLIMTNFALLWCPSTVPVLGRSKDQNNFPSFSKT